MASNNTYFSDTEKAILTTILYSDIFHFPLTLAELWKFLVSEKKISRTDFLDGVQSLSDTIFCKDGYYFLKGNEENVAARKRQQAEVKKKLQIARKAAFYLSYIPTIRFIGISGGLALENATKEDDIDLFVIVKKGKLFTTRLWIALVLEWLGIRRKRNEKFPANKVCVNLLIDENRLSWPKKSRDLYLAHEIVQIQPLFERNDMYQKFMDSNLWVRQFLPNSQDEKSVFIGNMKSTNYFVLQFVGFFLFLHPFELLLKRLQENYMKKYRTTEVVSRNVLAFHPNDYRTEIMSNLRSKCGKLGLLTNF